MRYAFSFLPNMPGATRPLDRLPPAQRTLLNDTRPSTASSSGTSYTRNSTGPSSVASSRSSSISSKQRLCHVCCLPEEPLTKPFVRCKNCKRRYHTCCSKPKVDEGFELSNCHLCSRKPREIGVSHFQAPHPAKSGNIRLVKPECSKFDDVRFSTSNDQKDFLRSATPISTRNFYPVQNGRTHRETIFSRTRVRTPNGAHSSANRNESKKRKRSSSLVPSEPQIVPERSHVFDSFFGGKNSLEITQARRSKTPRLPVSISKAQETEPDNGNASVLPGPSPPFVSTPKSILTRLKSTPLSPSFLELEELLPDFEVVISPRKQQQEQPLPEPFVPLPHQAHIFEINQEQSPKQPSYHEPSQGHYPTPDSLDNETPIPGDSPLVFLEPLSPETVTTADVPPAILEPLHPKIPIIVDNHPAAIDESTLDFFVSRNGTLVAYNPTFDESFNIAEKLKEIAARPGRKHKSHFGKHITPQLRKERADKGWDLHQEIEVDEVKEESLIKDLGKFMQIDGFGNVEPHIIYDPKFPRLKENGEVNEDRKGRLAMRDYPNGTRKRRPTYAVIGQKDGWEVGDG